MPVSCSCKILNTLTSVLFVGVLFFSCLAFPSGTLAQTELAEVYGRVTDPAGAVIVDAEVEVKNVETNVSVTAKTNQDGLYTVPSLHPGHYLINVRKPGFKSVTVTELTLNVQDNVVRNFALQVGSIAETVTVRGDELHINTTDASVSTVVDRQFAENLPMNGRSFQTLIELTPGVVVVPPNGNDNGQFSVNGQRAAANYWMVDGVGANIGLGAPSGPGNGFGGTVGSFSALGGTNSLVSVDAMQEFRIQTSTFAPEFGRTPGAQISIVTRSGTNQFHGALFDYFRNDVLDASNWFNGFCSPGPQCPLPKARERQNDFGGVIGGPVMKDKTFFFFSYEGLRLRLPQTALTHVPDLPARQNAMSAMQPFLNVYPLPNGPDNVATGVAQFDASFANPATLDAWSLRVDQRVGSKWTIFGRFNHSPSELDARGGGNTALSDVQVFRITTQTGTLGATWAASSSTANDLRFNYSRTNTESSYGLDTFGGATPLTTLPFPGGFTIDNSALELVIFNLGLGRGYIVGPFGHNIQHQINLVDALSWQTGSHSIKFGIDFRRLSPATEPQIYEQEPLFRTVGNAVNGNAFVGLIFSHAQATMLFRSLGAYAQDTWRVMPRLTLTYGLRWDIDTAPSSLSGPNIPAITGYSLNDFSQLGIASPGTTPFNTTYDNVAPRVGLAYQVSQSQNWQTVVRGGFGVFYDLASAETGNLIATGSAPPFGSLGFVVNKTFPYSAAQGAPQPIPATGQLSNVVAFNPNLKLPYTLEWNVAFEQSLGRQQTISTSYIGAMGRRLLQTTSVGSPPTNPNLTGVFVDNTASSDYNALQLQFQRRMSHGLQALASYTWSHSIDDASASSFGNIDNTGVPGSRNQNRGNSDFDIRHAFTAGITYDFPAPRIHPFVNAILRDWSTENFILARSSPPVDLSDPNFQIVNGGIQTNIRPDVVSGQPLYLYGSQYPGGKAFNPGAFTDPPTDPATGNPARQGNLPRNFLRGFGAAQWDFAVHRNFPIRESLKLQFRAEMFNVLNHPNFGPPNNQIGGAGFGLSSQTLGQSLAGSTTGGLGGGAFNPLYQIGGPRSVQLALKLQF